MIKTPLFLLLLFLGACSSSPKRYSTEDKLALQFRHYEDARAVLLKRLQDPAIPFDQKPIDRPKWESIIALNGDEAILPDDLAWLEVQQQNRIEAARKFAIEHSVIQLSDIRQQHSIKKFCQSLPKGGMLHVHPTGTLTMKSIRELLRLQNPEVHPDDFVRNLESSGASLSKDEINWLETLPRNKKFSQLPVTEQKKFEKLLILPKGHQDFSRFNAVFHFIGLLPEEIKVYEMALKTFAQNAQREGVTYVELTGHVTPEVLSLIKKVQDETKILIRINRSFNRTESLEIIEKKWQKLLKMQPNPYLVGIDFLDNEDSNSALEKGQILYGSALLAHERRESFLHRTMHAGEIGDPRDPRDAMILGAERIGHGVLLEKDVVALEYASRIKLPIEINLSSNLRLTSVSDLNRHPYLKYLRLGLPVSLSTDDEGIFETDMNHECEVAIDKTDVTYYELKQMAMNSIETSFASDADKTTLQKNLNEAFVSFEKNYVHR